MASEFGYLIKMPGHEVTSELDYETQVWLVELLQNWVIRFERGNGIASEFELRSECRSVGWLRNVFVFQNAEVIT